ncbi:MAG: glycosyltransferase family 2 protein [Planctomycetota bacterium]
MRNTLPHQLRRSVRHAPRVDLSIVAPAYDEEVNLGPLFDAIEDALGGRPSADVPAIDWELVLVDDGSRDSTAAVIERLCDRSPRVTGVHLARNCGQTAAIASGVAVARGRLVATIDADLQNDPRDLPRMIAELEGADAVVGYRTERRDSLLRRLSSRVANAVRNGFIGDPVRDTGCALRVFRASALEALPLFEGMHRFLPTLMRIHGFDVTEVPVAHRPRAGGRAKYGVLNRVFCAARDMLAVRWMCSRVIRVPVARVEGAVGGGVRATADA